ncbi:hypothetical protein WOLCODRAFT_150224 [Wolfiporia cocos MD-104 SS10]|uniref:Membrane protein BRI3 n=1 Tax=Wolfiporia cocos (strain MD-104) TaxID=742152 RepID=A0A2H3JF70_WOLCO|nr:hypothetical protein WOLCODRAFT_150224 [Wolfiporia cocos MD-104 SS10]
MSDSKATYQPTDQAYPDWQQASSVQPNPPAYEPSSLPPSLPPSAPAPVAAPAPSPAPAPSQEPKPAMSQAAAIGAQYKDEMFAQCAAGNHQVQKKYGVCGIICAVLLFPCGLFCLMCDVKKTCTRCGQIVP